MPDSELSAIVSSVRRSRDMTLVVANRFMSKRESTGRAPRVG